MTDQDINIAIAHVMGYTQEEPRINGRECWIHKDHPSHVGFDEIPDYCNDLNAIDEAVKAFIIGRINLKTNVPLQYEYGFWLEELVCGSICQSRWPQGRVAEVANATARIRSEAFLKTLEKWKQ